MSCSETSTCSSSKARIASAQQDHAGDDRRRAVGIQAGDLPALLFDPCRRGARAAFRRLPAAAGSRGPGWVVGVELLLDRGGGGGRAGDGDPAVAPARGSPRAGPRGRRRARRAASSCSSSGAGGSEWMWRSLMRTTPACSETWKRDLALDADDELRRAAADVDHDGRLLRRAGGRTSRRGTSAGPLHHR